MADEPVEVTLDRTDEMLKAIGELTNKQVMVGIPSSAAGRSQGPMNNATLAYIHENGSPAANIPARPFLRPTVNAIHDRAVAMLQKAATFTFDGKPAEADNQLQALGMLAAAEVKKTIVAGIGFAPLSPNTRRGRMQRAGMAIKPLIDTAQMLNAITYVIRKK